jgi:hypothetical protein
MGPKSRVGTSVSKRALQLLKLIEIYTEDIHNVSIISISFQSCKALFETPCTRQSKKVKSVY